jgi:lipoprotein-anchoring transpeptidase ErfK/SrfK
MTSATRHATRSSGFGRGIAALSAAVLTATVGGTAVTPTASATEVTASQPLAAIQHGHVARAYPQRHARRIEYVAPRRPLTGVRTILPVLGRTASRSWVRVRLPGRPNSHAGWIRTAHTRLTSTPWRVALDLSKRRVTVYYGGQVKRRFEAVVGTPSTPTPRGRYFIEEGVALDPWHAGGPFALATSARSNVFQEFEGGPGQIALHGTAGLGATVGSAASHGCIRLDTSAITWLAQRIGAGVPLIISN